MIIKFRYSLPEIIKEDPLISWPRKTVSSDAPPPTFYRHLFIRLIICIKTGIVIYRIVL